MKRLKRELIGQWYHMQMICRNVRLQNVGACSVLIYVFACVRGDGGVICTAIIVA